MTPAIMVLGTASNVGKSWLATGLCALARRRGVRVVPFKAQNLSNNAAPALDRAGGWGEIGRAQATQAQAAGVPAHVDMNPLLLKPMGRGGSQTILHGHPLPADQAARYWGERHRYWDAVTDAYDRLARTADLVVLEGAGSPVELNLMARDLVNLRMAHHANARVLLVGDIDRGGVFATLKGTVDLMSPADRALLAGTVVNRFRGDPRRFSSGPDLLEQVTGVPCRGVLPWRPDIAIDPEDGQDTHDVGAGPLDVCVLRLPTVSNFEDLHALGRLAQVRVRFEVAADAVGWPDLLVLPGAKNTLSDLAWLRSQGLDRVVAACAAQGVPVLGLCGGYQLLGETLVDADGHGGHAGAVPGLGLLPIHTEFRAAKRVDPIQTQTAGAWLLPAGLPVSGYEIHQGFSTVSGQALLQGPEGCVRGSVAGTYVHGLLDTAPVRAALVHALLSRRGLASEAPTASAEAVRARAFDQLADVLETYLDVDGLGL